MVQRRRASRLAEVLTVSTDGDTIEVEFHDGSFTQAVDQVNSFTGRNETAWAGCLGELPSIGDMIEVFHVRDRWWHEPATSKSVPVYPDEVFIGSTPWISDGVDFREKVFGDDPPDWQKLASVQKCRTLTISGLPPGETYSSASFNFIGQAFDGTPTNPQTSEEQQDYDIYGVDLSVNPPVDGVAVDGSDFIAQSAYWDQTGATWGWPGTRVSTSNLVSIINALISQPGYTALTTLYLFVIVRSPVSTDPPDPNDYGPGRNFYSDFTERLKFVLDGNEYVQ